MKKYYMLCAAVAAITAISCNKDLASNDSSVTPVKGSRIQVSVGDPEPCVEDQSDNSAVKPSQVATKVSQFRVARNPKWDAGDSFQFFAYNANSQLLTDWGAFTTDEGSVTSGNSNATFWGYLPEGFTKATGGNTFACIAHNESNKSYTLTYETNPRYVYYTNIPAEQDGTGLKYSMIVSTATYDESTKTLGGFGFNVRSALCALTLPAGSNVVKIEITMSYDDSGTNSPSSQYLVSKGDKQDLKWQAGNWTCLGGGGCNTITIYKNGEALPEANTPVYFACLRTQSGAKYGLCTLTFKFTNAEGLVAEKSVPLKRGDSFVNIAVGTKINNFGTVTFAEGDFKAVTE